MAHRRIGFRPENLFKCSSHARFYEKFANAKDLIFSKNLTMPIHLENSPHPRHNEARLANGGVLVSTECLK
ncbi:MAG: hypothetical protein ABJ118_02600, partial [Luteolibacter sp.]